ncbi:MAG: hypothetical protein BWY82_02509 [Verrucomicrobia bacterium ADurb.Bin474]|nr:MAG: hypothetical protein BWY82_02509 [Verrucomicrobia bacterium ADurb.Bin474]
MSRSSLRASAAQRENLFFFILLIPSENFYLSPGFASRHQAHKEIHHPILHAFVRKSTSIPPLRAQNTIQIQEFTPNPYDPIPGECTMSINVVTMKLSMQGLV